MHVYSYILVHACILLPLLYMQGAFIYYMPLKGHIHILGFSNIAFIYVYRYSFSGIVHVYCSIVTSLLFNFHFRAFLSVLRHYFI